MQNNRSLGYRLLQEQQVELRGMQKARAMTQPTPEPDTFGRRVRAARERAGWTQQQLADALGRYGLKVDTSAITRIENGSRDPRLSEAESIANAFGLGLAELIPKGDNGFAVKKLWLELDDAGFELLDAVYEYGVKRRALNEALDAASADMSSGESDEPAIRRILRGEEVDAIREFASRRAIRDWDAIRADFSARSTHNPPRDDAVFDAET